MKKILTILLLSLFILSPGAYAQVKKGTISGKITDSNSRGIELKK